MTFRRYALTPQKHLLAGPNRILIDDNDRNIEAFRAAGGIGILFPQPWNANHESQTNKTAYVQECLINAIYPLRSQS